MSLAERRKEPVYSLILMYSISDTLKFINHELKSNFFLLFLRCRSIIVRKKYLHSNNIMNIMNKSVSDGRCLVMEVMEPVYSLICTV